MKKFKVQIEPEALTDIQEITDWYNEQQSGLGTKFQKATINHINSLNRDPQRYSIRYNQIRCGLVRKFPYMSHFYINEESRTVEVLAVISTKRNPEIWKLKTSGRTSP